MFSAENGTTMQTIFFTMCAPKKRYNAKLSKVSRGATKTNYCFELRAKKKGYNKKLPKLIEVQQRKMFSSRCVHQKMDTIKSFLSKKGYETIRGVFTLRARKRGAL